MGEEDFSNEVINLLNDRKVDEKIKKEIIYYSRKEVNRIFYGNYNEWEKYKKIKNIENKYTDEEAKKRLFNKIVYDKIMSYLNSKQEQER